MCELVVKTTDSLWKLYKEYVGEARKKYGEAVRKAFDEALEPLGYTQTRYHNDSGSMTVSYTNKIGNLLVIYYIGEGFIHGSLYLGDASDKEEDIGLWGSKTDPLSIDDFVAVLIEKERELALQQVVNCLQN